VILPAVDVFVFSRESVSVCHLPPTKEEIYVFARVRLFVCLSVIKIAQKGVHGF